MQKRAAFLMWYPRHLYWNWKHLCSEMVKNDIDLTILTHRKEIAEEAMAAGIKSQVIAPKLESSWTRFGVIGYIICWLWAWLWIAPRLLKYDLLIAPSNSTPLNHIASIICPFLLTKFSLGSHEKAYIEQQFKNVVNQPKSTGSNSPSPSLYKYIDRTLGCHFIAKGRPSRPNQMMTVISQLHKDFHCTKGWKESQIVITGSSNYVGLNQLDMSLVNAVQAHMSDCPENAAIISIFPSFIRIVDREIIFLRSAMASLAEKVGILHVVIKLHPRFPDEQLSQLRDSFDHPLFSISIINAKFDDLMNAALIQLSGGILLSGSNIGFISCALKKPMYSYLPNERSVDFFASAGVSRLIEKPNDLAELWGKSFTQGNDDHIFAAIDNPSKEIANLVKKLLTVPY